MKEKAGIGEVGVLVEVVDSFGVKCAGAADKAVDFVAFVEEEFSKVGAVLAGYAGD